MGQLTDFSKNLLEDLSSKELDGSESHLYPTRNGVYEWNCLQLDKLHGNVMEYISLDSQENGSRITDMDILEELNRSTTAELVLELKIGSSVMLIKNMTPKLFNGKIGKVVELDTNGDLIVVDFDDLKVEISRVSFECKISSGIVWRCQFPLILSYALTIHKAQVSAFYLILRE
jgi:hypothetical protein